MVKEDSKKDRHSRKKSIEKEKKKKSISKKEKKDK
jgi:hypothetical protein